ncbi:16S rRNA (guanine(527)-N(7))-methyltransferase RsmG [Candidatus Atribacteria bacterium 1244-E10-H5-B2]|nr:MAG: 16S rRNA (guanine(527)-N(7))-methyltransferase RsmG [Candidatus Atribacteria bacterium 1244-E10-H5-B2]
MLKDDENILIDGCQKMGININNEQIRKFSRYLELLVQWNQKINLTSLKTPKEIIIKHFLDSISCVKVINKYVNIEGISVIDVGAGAGFPGMPIKIIYPSIRLSLLEARKKKTIFLEKVTEEINFQKVKILNGRAEIFGRSVDFREKYDIVISRAVAPLNVLSEYCLPLVRVGGLFIAQKGRSYKQETEKSLKTVQVLGGELIGAENVRIPFINQERYLLVIKKIKDTPSKYPRKEGLPQKRPL